MFFNSDRCFFFLNPICGCAVWNVPLYKKNIFTGRCRWSGWGWLRIGDTKSAECFGGVTRQRCQHEWQNDSGDLLPAHLKNSKHFRFFKRNSLRSRKSDERRMVTLYVLVYGMAEFGTAIWFFFWFWFRKMRQTVLIFLLRYLLTSEK